MPTLKLRRLRAMALEAFKILNNQGPVHLHDLLNFKNQNYSFRYTRTAEIPKVRTSNYGLSSFRYSAAKLWNSLPQHFRDEINFSNSKSYQCLEWRELCLYFLFCKIALLLFAQNSFDFFNMYCHFPCAFNCLLCTVFALFCCFALIYLNVMLFDLSMS